MAAKRKTAQSRGRLFPKGGGADTGWPPDTPSPSPPSPPSGPMTCARAKALHEKVNSLLITLDLGTSLDGMLLTACTLCVIRYIPQESWLEVQEDGLLPRQEEQ